MAKPKPKPKREPQQFRMEYRKHTSAEKGEMRVRRSDWADDVFSIVSYEGFERMREVFAQFSIPFVDLDIEDP